MLFLLKLIKQEMRRADMKVQAGISAWLEMNKCVSQTPELLQ